ncbi:MAG TPA: hypothetical protein VM617_03890 [Thermoanaerobaculia bacterium]|nr:hypothetical protein [Thermoanaerobaculia bacterium]
MLACSLVTVAFVLAGCGAPAVEGPLPGTTIPADRDERIRRFVLDFMEARAGGDEAAARLFLSPIAGEQFASGAGGLTLTGDGAGFEAWALLAVEAADPSSSEVRVRVESAAGEAWEELLFVGVGPGPDGTARELTVRGAERLPAPE